MSRLLLFSGGVESTAMMTLRRPEDIIITIEDTSDGEKPTFNKLAVERIASAMNFTVHFCTYEIPCNRPQELFIYQLWYFLFVAGIVIVKNPQITEVWYGIEKVDSDGYASLEHPIKKFTQLQATWNAMFPTVPLIFPLAQYTKQEQWALIPNNIKPLVRTCLRNTIHGQDINCQRCYKCKELQKLLGSCLYPTN